MKDGKKVKRTGIWSKVAIVSVTVVAILALAVGVAFAVTLGGSSRNSSARSAGRSTTSKCIQSGASRASSTGVRPGNGAEPHNTDHQMQGSGSGRASSTGVRPGNGAEPYNTDCQLQGSGSGHGSVALPMAAAPRQ